MQPARLASETDVERWQANGAKLWTSVLWLTFTTAFAACPADPGLSSKPPGYVFDALHNADPARLFAGAARKLPERLSTTGLCATTGLSSSSFGFAGIEGAEWRAVPHSRRLQENGGLEPMPLTQGVLFGGPSAGTSKSAAKPAASPSPAPAAQGDVSDLPPALPKLSDDMADLEGQLGGEPKFNEGSATPGTTVAPVPPAQEGDFPGLQVTPVQSVPAPAVPAVQGLPATGANASQAAVHAPLPTLQVGNGCSRALTSVSVATGAQPQLRLHFAACNGGPAAVVAAQLEKDSTVSEKPGMAGHTLWRWMCQVDPGNCKEILAEQNGAQTKPAETLSGLIGQGPCVGQGVIPKASTDTSPSACKATCHERIIKNRADPSFGSCTGFAFDSAAKSCTLYTGWAVKESDPTQGADQTCYSLKYEDKLVQEQAQAVPQQQPQELQSQGSMNLEVVAIEPQCFQGFEWYSLSKAIPVGHASWNLIGLLATRSGTVLRLARDCSGKLTGDCEAADKELSPLLAQFSEVPDHDQAEPASPSPGPLYHDPMPVPRTRGAQIVNGVMGDESYTALYSERDGVWAWHLISCVAAVALGFLVTAGLITCCTYKAPPPTPNVGDEKIRHFGVCLVIGSLAAVLHGDVPAKDLLRLRVKPTYNDPADDTAFYHSVASFGLSFAVGENAAQLAMRRDADIRGSSKEVFGNGSVDVGTCLEAAAESDGREILESRLAAEAELLAAIRSDNADQVRRVMRHCVARHQLAQADTYHDAADQGAIYHLVASYGLKFEIGDTPFDLAERNGCKNAARVLRRYRVTSALRLAELEPDTAAKGPAPPEPSAETPIDLKAIFGGFFFFFFGVQLTNAMTGEEICTAPSPGGCRIFLKGAAALTAGTEDAEEAIQLSTLVLSTVQGVYVASIKLGDFEEQDFGEGLRPGRLHLIGGRGMGRDPPANVGLKLHKDGMAEFVYEKRPFDRGHCAPPTYSVPGVEVVLTEGSEGTYIRGMSSNEGRFQQEQVILLAMVKDWIWADQTVR
eukprot:s10_g21.t2